MAVPRLRGVPKCLWVIRPAANTCPRRCPYLCAEISTLWAVAQICIESTRCTNVPALSSALVEEYRLKAQPERRRRVCPYVHTSRECIWCWQIWWLIWACWSVKSHRSLRGTCRLPWSGSWLRIPDVTPNPVSQPLLSSAVESGRTAEQISLCFPALAKAAPANTHQHGGTWSQLTFFHYCQLPFFFLYSSAYVRRLRTTCYQRRQIKRGFGFIKQHFSISHTFF